MLFLQNPLLPGKHIEARLKLAAAGLQAVALTLFGGAMVVPLLNPAIVVGLWVRLAAGVVIGVKIAVA